MDYSDYVDLAVCTNLDRRPERWSFMLDQFEREQMVVHRIAGIDGRKRLPLFGRMPLDPNIWPDVMTWNPGVAGAMASFLQAVTLAWWSEARTLLYMEDDCVLPPNFQFEVQRVMRHCPRDWDVVNFGGWHRQPTKDIPHNDEWHECVETLNLHCVLVHARAFPMIHSTLMAKRCDPDFTLASNGLLRQYAPKTLHVPQKVGFSDCHNRFLGADQGRMDPAEFLDKSRGYKPSFMPDFYVREQTADSDLRIISEVMDKDTYGLADLPFTPKRVIDAGAHIGSFTWKMLREFPECEVACIEPDPQNFQGLQFNSQYMKPTPRLFRAALSFRGNELDFFTSVYPESSNTGMSRLADRPRGRFVEDAVVKQPIKVNAIPLGHVLHEMGWHEFDLLKLDIEGEEIDVLENIDTKSVKMIVGEFHTHNDFQRLTVHPKFRDWAIQITDLWDAGQGIFRMIRKDVLDGSDES